MSKTLLATLAAFGTALGGCALSSPQSAPGASAPAPRAIAQALLGDRPIEASSRAPADPDRLEASYRALNEHLDQR